MYLVMNDKTQHYDIYAKVNDKVVRLDDTTVDLSGYATKEQLEAVSGGLGGTVYAATKADLSTSDDSVFLVTSHSIRTQSLRRAMSLS